MEVNQLSMAHLLIPYPYFKQHLALIHPIKWQFYQTKPVGYVTNLNPKKKSWCVSISLKYCDFYWWVIGISIWLVMVETNILIQTWRRNQLDWFIDSPHELTEFNKFCAKGLFLIPQWSIVKWFSVVSTKQSGGWSLRIFWVSWARNIWTRPIKNLWWLEDTWYWMLLDMGTMGLKWLGEKPWHHGGSGGPINGPARWPSNPWILLLDLRGPTSDLDWHELELCHFVPKDITGGFFIMDKNII